MVKEFIKGKRYKTAWGYILEFVQLDKEETVYCFKSIDGKAKEKYLAHAETGLFRFYDWACEHFIELPDETV